MTPDDRQAIRELVENWVVWRDAGDWERFRTVWHDDGRMMATWFQGPADEFIRVSREGFERGVSHPALPRRHVDRRRRRPRDRADEDDDLAARARSTASLCDVVCTGRFYDFFERRDGRWGLVLRQPIYEKDRLDPVDPAAALELDPATCSRASPRATATSPTCSSGIGYDVKPDMPGLTGPEVERALRARRGVARRPPALIYHR